VDRAEHQSALASRVRGKLDIQDKPAHRERQIPRRALRAIKGLVKFAPELLNESNERLGAHDSIICGQFQRRSNRFHPGMLLDGKIQRTLK
jgi:hypothetical protein